MNRITPSSTSTTPIPAHPSPGATPGHALLQAFAGSWSFEGRQLESDVGPAAHITGVERYDWLSGGNFLVHHFHARVGDGKAACIEMIGFDDEANVYPVSTFYDNGETNTWTMRDGTGVWIMNGEWPVAGQVTHVRCAMVFVEPRVRTCVWEYAVTGAWRPFWELRAMSIT